MTGELADDRFLSIALFLLFLACCLSLSMWASPDLRDEDSLFTDTDRPGPMRSGLAFTGDFISVAGVLYLIGIVAVAGTDGVLVVAAAAASPLLMRRWLAGKLPIRKGWSFGDVLAHRLPSGPARRAAATGALVATVPLLVAQLVPIGQITAALMGLPGEAGEQAGIVLVGALMLACVTIGGARGATALQICKAAAFLVMGPLLCCLVLFQFRWDPGAMLSAASRAKGSADAYLSFGGLFGTDLTGMLDLASITVTVLLGAAFLPYLVTRLSGCDEVWIARRAAGWGAGAVILLCTAAVILGFGLRALVGARELAEQGPRGGNNLLLLAAALDGNGTGHPGMLLTFVSCAAFLAVLASASVLLLSASAALVHDLGWGAGTGTGSGRGAAAKGRAPVPGQPSPARHMPGNVRARLALLGVGAVCLVLAVVAREVNPQFWLTLTYTQAASVLLPALCYSLGRRPFPLAALRRCVYGGTAVTLALVAFSPAMSGAPDAVFPHADWQLWPLYAPGLVSVPAGFVLGAIRRAGEGAPDSGTRPAPGPGPVGTVPPQDPRGGAARDELAGR
ncbi:sodium:solute symporter family transporter [Streptomyces daliensis]